MYDVFVIDPPWPKKKGGIRSVRPLQGRFLDYATLSVEAIFTILDTEIFTKAKEIHTVFLWNIDEFLRAGEMAMEERGYKRHARMIWDKGNGVSPAFSVRYSHEYLTWFYKPKFQPISKETRGKFTTVFRESARQHSRKPDIVYETIKLWYPEAVRLDVFSREKRDGWEQWGDEVNKKWD
jgi:N6-adenosine-specific RNA methylase IME4